MGLLRYMSWLVLLSLFLAVSGCHPNYERTLHSGTIHDDDIEEPLSAAAKQYETVLIRSNELIEMVKQRQFEVFYQQAFAPNLKKEISQKSLVSLLENVEKEFGAMQGYKPMQWYFHISTENGVAYVMSQKIVDYEKERYHFRFVFAQGGDLRQIIGFHIGPRR
ncbi:MAG: hypothetical protein KDC35_02845 [Acidobacteria bacterium]|nr:hypothetical protein [Acidobacteriota bacterium]